MEISVEERVLFILSTPMQIITAVNIIEQYGFTAEAICLKDHLSSAEVVAHRISQVGIFQSVKALQSQSKENLNLSMYDKIFVTNSTFLKTYKNEIQTLDLEINIFDEGTMTYLSYFIEECYLISKKITVYLYEPELANYSTNKKISIKLIKKINACNIELLKKLNSIFKVNTNPVTFLDKRVKIFFSQPFKSRLSWKARIRKVLGFFRTHSRWEFIAVQTAKLQEYIIELICKKHIDLYRKFHPREKNKRWNYNILQIDYPWELYILNHPDTKVDQYSLFSSVLTSSFVLGDSYDVKNYYLYPIVVKELEEFGSIDIIDKEVLEFFNRLVKLGKVIPVTSLEELERICQDEV